MHDVVYVGLVSVFPKWDIADMLNGMNSVIPRFHIAGSAVRSQLTKPFFMGHHVIGFAESTNHIFSGLEVFVRPDSDIEFALYLIMNIPP